MPNERGSARGPRAASTGMAAAAGVVVLLGGCRAIEGDPVADPEAAEPLAAATAIGELRTVDPCALTDLRVLSEHGKPGVNYRDTLDSCLVEVPLGGGSAEVRLGPIRGSAAIKGEHAELRKLSRGARLLRGPGTETEADDACTVQVEFADRIVVAVRARPKDYAGEVGNETRCALAETPAEGVFAAVRDGEVGQWEPPENSLARESACDLLKAGDLPGAVGLSGSKPVAAPTGHECAFGERGTESVGVILDFRADNGSFEQAGARPVTIGGRDSLSMSVRGRGGVVVCVVEAPHIPLADDGDGDTSRVETARLRVSYPPSKGDDPCKAARSIAGKVWPRLPQP